MDDFISRTSRTMNEVTEKARNTVKKYSTPKTISSIIEAIASIVCIIGINLVGLEFDFTQLLELSFWVYTGCMAVGVFLLFRSIVNARFESTAKRDNVVKARDRYNNLNAKKERDLKIFLDEYNLATKIDAYVSNVNQKIFRLENKLRKTFKDKKIIKINKKIVELKSMITNEYVDANIEKIKVKYYIVYYSDFYDETVTSHKGIITRPNYNKEFNTNAISTMWGYLISSCLFAVAIFNPLVETGDWYVAKIIGTILMIVIRATSALLKADEIYDKTVTNSLMDRADILEEYLEWKKKNPSRLDEALEKQKEELKIEYEKKTKQAVEEALVKFANASNNI